MLLLGNPSRMVRLLLMVLGLLFGSVTFADDKGRDRQAQLDQFAYRGPVFLQGRKSLDEFRKLGKVVSERHRAEASPYDSNKKIEFVEMMFDGLRLSGHIQQGSFKPIQVRVTSARWKILLDLHVGTSSAKVRQVLGQPTKQADGTEEYCGETECTLFSVKNGRITAVEFSYYAD